MKTLLTILFVVFGLTSQGYIIGTGAGSTGLAYSEWDDNCAKWEGEERECTFDERALMVSLLKLINRQQTIGVIE